jgi:hypothetical protein
MVIVFAFKYINNRYLALLNDVEKYKIYDL